jgi:hypothetical protein
MEKTINDFLKEYDEGKLDSELEEKTVIVDELYLITMQSENTALRTALEHLVGVIEAHDLESLDCDDRGDYFCDCLSLAVKQAKEALDKTK